MSIRWTLVVVVGLLVSACGSTIDSPDNDGGGGSSASSDNGSSGSSGSSGNSGSCESGYTSKTVCLMCGLAGGCAKMETKCARTCSSSENCSDLQLACWEGVCQIGGCR